MQHRPVVPAAKLTADFLQRRDGELPRNVHGDLAGKDVGAAVGTHDELRVTHLVQIEVLAYMLADRLESWDPGVGHPRRRMAPARGGKDDSNGPLGCGARQRTTVVFGS